MSNKANGVNYGKTVPQKGRRERAITALQLQLTSGEKTEKKSYDKKVPLLDKDITRINKEIETLKSKL